ncbi:MAG: hypothetical protein ACI8UD_000063 [Planctomycetota bacterium]|jgi:hypothetical protein
MLARLCRTAASLLLIGAAVLAQTPPVVSPPVTSPPVSSPPVSSPPVSSPPVSSPPDIRVIEEPPPPPPPETQDPAPTAADGAGSEGRRGRRGEGQGRGSRGKRSNDLPEFTPVAAPTLAALEGKQYFWFTMYPDLVVKFDPETDKVVQQVQLKGGMFWRSTLTHDRKRLLVVTNQQHTIEVVDMTTGTLVGNHLFQEEGFTLRIRSVRECPGGVFWFVQTDRVKKEIDRYSFEATQYLLYDSSKKKIVSKVPKLPDAMSRARLSADGTHWLSSNDGNLQFLNARTFKEIDKIDLSTPRFFGAGAIRLSSTDLLDDRDPNRSLQIFTTTDPVEKRRTNWGLVDIDLKNRKVVNVTEWGPSKSSWGMRVAHKTRIAVTMGRGRGAERQMVTYDLNTGEQLTEAYHEFRPRRSLVAISPNGDKAYVGVAGSDFEIFDIKTLKRLPTVELDGEIVGTIHVVDA